MNILYKYTNALDAKVDSSVYDVILTKVMSPFIHIGGLRQA
jgi:DNA-binding protein Fis